MDIRLRSINGVYSLLYDKNMPHLEMIEIRIVKSLEDKRRFLFDFFRNFEVLQIS